VPLIAFAFLYGLSMDHEVFILSRIREEHDRTRWTRTRSTPDRIHAGQGLSSLMVAGDGFEPS
jgi:uncharacterized membrane protein YdfJ with MMPL/SSD domain